MDTPCSMVQRSGDKLIIRSVVSGNQLYPQQQQQQQSGEGSQDEDQPAEDGHQQINNTEKSIRQQENDLPQCKIKRNYSCNSCSFFTQNPRRYLIHLRDLHGEKIVINECKKCLYASRHYQKLVRHMKMVHGTTEGINELSQSRKRSLNINSGASQSNKEFRPNTIKRINLGGNSIPDQLLFQPPPPNELLPDDFDLFEGAYNTNNKQLKCPVCEYTTLEHAQLLDHEKCEHTNVKFYRCVKCNYVTHIKTRFSKHVKYHSMPMIKCIICDFRTPYKWNLDRHMKNHGGTGQFKCASCNFTADIKQSLTVHELNHHVPPLNNGSSTSVGGIADLFNMSTEDQRAAAFDMFQNNVDKKYLEMMINEANAFKQNWLLQNVVAASTSGEQDALNLDTKSSDSTRKARPIPNLIPIQNMAASPLLNLSKSKTDDEEADENDDEEGGAEEETAAEPELMEPTTAENFSKQAMASAFFGMQRKNLSFFDKLKEKLVASSSGGGSDHISFACKCGYNPKSLSDSILHQNYCGTNDKEEKDAEFDEDDFDDDEEEGTLSISSNLPNMSSTSTSTRCQYCRHRCKSSIDLLTHLQTCSDAKKYYLEHKPKLDEIAAAGIAQSVGKQTHPMENKIFVWNNNNQSLTDEDDDDKDDSTAASAGNSEKQGNDDDLSSNGNDVNFFGIETAPGYGEVTQDLSTQPASVSMKKVYKCPHCSFWASTASRFHVHIVGHLNSNKKPFECSLCAYRSNWRWDITKHIRLKTIRDSNHKTARVLMNDETGRRNYTKYNKYVTLMKVSDAENDDKKSMKSGEMSLQNQQELEQMQQLHQQQQSAAEQQLMKATIEHPFDLSLKIMNNAKPDTVPNLIKMPFNLFANLPVGSTPTASATSISNFINENFDASKDVSSASSSPNNESKRSHFKCKKCNFKDSNRETVLAHVKQHYHEAGLMLENAKNQFLTSSLTESLIAAALQQNSAVQPMMTTPVTVAAVTSPTTMVSGASGSSSGGRQQQQQHGGGTKRENGETNNETSSHQHGGRGVWRGPAPYRCGHCKQVSNWKHVIQRHCRLKHNGIILIESNNVASSGNTNNNNNNNSKPPQPSTSSVTLSQMLKSAPPEKQQQQQSMIITTNSATTAVASSPALTCNIASTSSTENPQFQSSMGLFSMKPLVAQSPNPVNVGLLANKKKHQCTLCPYVTESKAQLLYHKSFHKPKGDPFQCNLCSYNVAKKHLLHQHKKMHKNDMLEKALQAETAGKSPQKSETVAIDLTTGLAPNAVNYGHQDTSVVADKQLYFCSLCPARYLSLKEILFHKQMHNSNLPNKCDICTYTSTAITSVHLTVHTFYYLEKTREFQAKYKTNEDYPQPNLTMISMNNEFYYITTPYVEIEKMSQDETDENDDEDQPDDDEMAASKEPTEKCPHCPFHSNMASLKDHLQMHFCISGKKMRNECEHCDYSHDSEDHLLTHKKLHFLFLNNNNNNSNNYNNNNGHGGGLNKNFYTQYDNIEIKIEKKGNGGGGGGDEEVTIYKESNNNSDSFYYKFIENEKLKMNEKIILSIP